MPGPVRIFVSPMLAERWGPEVQWTFQTLLTAVGRPWHLTTDPACEVDISYAERAEPGPAAPIVLRAETAAWEAPPAGTAQRLGAAISRRWDAEGVDVVADAFALLTGADERTWRSDRHGHHIPPNAAEAALPRAAVVSQLAQALDLALRERLGPAEHCPWPAGKAFAAVSTHDVDYPQAIRWLEPWRVLRRQETRITDAFRVLSGSLHHWQFEAWLKREQRLGITSAFYFVARRGSLLQYAAGTPDPFYDVRSPRFRSVLRELADREFEVGLQPSYRAWHRLEQLLREKEVLEEAVGRDVHGGRHHYWRLDPESPEETLFLHEQAGLLYDCSLAYERLLGWRRGLASPFRPFLRRLRRPLDVVQLPTAWMDDQVFGHAAFNATQTAEERHDALSELVDRAASAGGVFVVDIHEYVFEGRLFPGRLATWERLWADLVARSDVWLASPVDVARRWRRHEERLLALSTTPS